MYIGIKRKSACLKRQKGASLLISRVFASFWGNAKCEAFISTAKKEIIAHKMKSPSGLSGHEKKLGFQFDKNIEKYSNKKKESADTIYANVGSNFF